MNRPIIINSSKPVDARKTEQLFQSAFSAHQAGKFEEAKRAYLKVLKVLPADMETLYLLGTAYSQTAQFEEASRYLAKALKLNPAHPDALNNMGLTLKGMRKPDEALVYYRRALAIRPDYADALNNVGNALEYTGKLDEAEVALRQAIVLEPDHADAHCNLGLVLNGKDRFEEAAQSILRGLALRPDHAISYDYLGSIYKIWGRLDEALACLDRAVALDPEAYSARNNRGAVLEELARFDDAMADYQRAAEIRQSDSAARWNQAFLYLRQGVLDKGWEAHELRLTKEGQVSIRFPFPEWDGGSLEGKTVLIYAEQGLGDEIMFASCIPDLLARAGHCIIECAPRLATLFARSFPTATIVGGDRNQVGWLVDMPPIDVQVAMGSMMRFVRPTIDSFPRQSGYLLPQPASAERWRARVAQLGPGLKIGICWRSGLVSGTRHRYYSELSEWGEIFAVPGVHFVNLQYGECAAELDEARARFGVEIVHFDDLNLRDQIDESTGLMAGLDLVISAATAVLQTAGALGVPSFALNSESKPWNALGRSDFMPWYPKTRLFGQAVSGDWSTQLALVAQAVKEVALGFAPALSWLTLATGGEVAVDAAPEDVAHYVLKEQGKWFDAEYDFVIGLAAPQMRIVDVGAGVGAYAVALARRVAAGRVYAVAFSADETGLLMQSRMRNGLEHALDVVFGGDDLALDVLFDQRGLDNIALVRLDRAASRAPLLARAQRFFSHNSPLVMFGIGAGEQFDVAVPHWLEDQGYAIYRLVPGLGVLMPCNTTDELDAYGLNLFACKPDRAALLERQGKLVSALHALTSLPGVDQPYWQQYLGAQPYAAARVEGWAASKHKDPDWEVYWMALNLFAMAKTANGTPAERYACLQGADTVLNTLLQEHANLPRLVSLCRVMIELGKREMTVGILNQICDLLDAGMSWALDEPLLALSDQDALWTGASGDPKWVLATVLAQRENWRAFSTCFTGEESLPALLEVRTLGYADADVERKIALIMGRFGKPG
jgi:tetratricopeptide (TPR) repeat protein/SAM-dependent methyltransferase